MSLSKSVLDRVATLEASARAGKFAIHFSDNGPADYSEDTRVIEIRFVEGLHETVQIEDLLPVELEPKSLPDDKRHLSPVFDG